MPFFQGTGFGGRSASRPAETRKGPFYKAFAGPVPACCQQPFLRHLDRDLEDSDEGRWPTSGHWDVVGLVADAAARQPPEMPF